MKARDVPAFNHLLLIDDDEGLGLSLKAILQKAGYQVAWAKTGQEAIDLAKSRTAADPWCAALIDIRLPDMNGLDVLRELKRINPDVGAIMMTGHTDTETAVGALNEGAYAYVQKPYNVSEVKAAIEKLVERQKLTWENRAMLVTMAQLNADLEKRVAARTEELQAANLKLMQTIEKLREADAAKTVFLSMLSHELRTPLTGIIGFASTLLQQLDHVEKPVLERFLKIIHSSGSTLARLVEGLLEFANVQKAGMDLRFGTADLPSLVANVVETIKVIKPEARIEVEIPQDCREIESDSDRLRQVFTNLIENAVKYSEGAGVVRVQARKNGDDIQVTVADDGPGISDEVQEKIFDAFYRGDGLINMKTRGTGLGLTISKAIVEALGGRIWLESKPGHGSSFCFSHPISRQTIPLPSRAHRK